MRFLTVACLVFLACLTLIPNSFGTADTTYFRELVNKGNATYYDACRIIAILESGQDAPDAKLDELTKGLSELEVIPAAWKDKKETDLITRGELAYMLFRSLEMKGGLTTRIFGASERYAFRECVDKKLIVEGYASQKLSGDELISILAEAEKYQEKHLPGRTPSVVVPPKPQPAEKTGPAKDEPKGEEEANPLDEEIDDDAEDEDETDEDEPQPSK